VSPTASTIGSSVGNIAASGFDGTNRRNTAEISFIVDSTVGAGYVPGCIAFLTPDPGGNSFIERMRVASGGSVGIGTNSPTARLQVEGSASTAPVFSVTDLATGTTPLLTVLTNGVVGIGTAGPDRNLDVLDASNPQLRLTHTDGSVYADLGLNSGAGFTIAPNGTTMMTVSNNMVAIGTTAAPAYPLDIYSGATHAMYVDSSGSLITAGSVISGRAISCGSGYEVILSGNLTRLYSAESGGLSVYENDAVLHRLRIYGTTKKLDLGGGATNIVLVTCPTNLFTGFTLNYTVRATDGTDVQVERGEVLVAAANKAGVFTVSMHTNNISQALTAGSLATTWSWTTSGTNFAVTLASAPIGITATTNTVKWTILSDANDVHCTFTPQ
jgi:hypothetical protein